MPVRARRRRELLLQSIQTPAKLALIFSHLRKQASGFRCLLRGHTPMAVEIYRVMSHAITVLWTGLGFGTDHPAAAG